MSEHVIACQSMSPFEEKRYISGSEEREKRERGRKEREGEEREREKGEREMKRERKMKRETSPTTVRRPPSVDRRFLKTPTSVTSARSRSDIVYYFKFKHREW